MCGKRLLLRACVGVLTFTLGWAGAVLTGTAHSPGFQHAPRVVFELAPPRSIDPRRLPPPPGSLGDGARHCRMHPAFEWCEVPPDVIGDEFNVPATPPPPRPPAR